MCANAADRCLVTVHWMMQSAMLVILGLLMGVRAHGQMQLMPVPVNAPILELTMYDDGCGIAISDSAGVYVTHDHWEASAKVIPPGVDATLEFVPRSVDTASTGAIIVVGFLRTGRNDSPILTYAMRSSDHGRTWEEIGARRSGRFQSLSFRGSEFGLVVYEMRTSNRKGINDTFAIYVDRVDDRLNSISTVTFVAPNTTGYDCYAGEDAVTCVITSLGKSGALLSVVSPCRYYNHQEPEPSLYWTSLYRTRQPDGEYLRVTTLPAETEEGLKRIRPRMIKETLLGDAAFSGLRRYASFDDGLTWRRAGCQDTRQCQWSIDSVYMNSMCSDMRSGFIVTSEVVRECPDEDSIASKIMFFEVDPIQCRMNVIDSIWHNWAYTKLDYVPDFYFAKHIQYGGDGFVHPIYYSFYLTSNLTSPTVDTLYLFVRKPTTTTSAPNAHTMVQTPPSIRVAASTIHVRMPMHTHVDRTLRIVDVTGREIRRHEIATENEEIYIGDLPRGMYYAVVPGIHSVAICNP